MRILFFGTPEFSTPFLKGLIDDPDIEVAAVVTQPDKPVGRGQELKAPATKTLALSHHIPVIQPKSLKNEHIAGHLTPFEAEAFVVVAYGKLIPKNILEIPTLGCVNVHPSLLPEYRGPSPMQWAIASGDDMTGVSIMLLDEGMDTGPILAQETFSLDGDETYTSLQKKVHERGVPLLVATLKRYADGEIQPIQQQDDKASMTSLLSRDDGRIDWTESVVDIERKSRAYEAWPGLWTVWNRNGKEVRLKMHHVEPVDLSLQYEPGTVHVEMQKLYIEGGDGTLEIHELQPEGKPRMNAQEFLKGYEDIHGAKLG